VKYAVPDIGLHRAVRGAIVFAAIKAANDAGLKVPLGDEVVPSEDRIMGKHIAEYAKLLKERGLFEVRFSKYLERGLDPEKLLEHFNEVKKAILKAYGLGG
jgi:large subunit ribosomal protein L18